MKIYRFFTMALLLAMAGCGRPTTVPPASNTGASEPGEIRSGINLDKFCQHWVHSSEEEGPTGGGLVYRPRAFKDFPPSRFRMEYKFSRNGDCEWLHLSPDDAHRFKTAKWTLNPKDKNVLEITADGTSESFRIVTLSKDLLRLAPLARK